jgi:hypothetical protein
MKIYIDKYNIEKIYKNLELFNSYLINKTNQIEVYSDEGVFTIDQNNIYRITYLDKPIKMVKYSENINMIIDMSETKTTIVNQIPVNYTILNILTQNYQINARSKIKFVIDFVLTKNRDYKIHNFYFDVPDDINGVDVIDINSPLFKEDINVFLFHLN